MNGSLFSHDLSVFNDDSTSFQDDKVLHGVCALTQALIRVSKWIPISASLTVIYVQLL